MEGVARRGERKEKGCEGERNGEVDVERCVVLF